MTKIIKKHVFDQRVTKTRWSEMVIVNIPYNSYPFLVQTKDEQGWFNYGSFKTEAQALKCFNIIERSS